MYKFTHLADCHLGAQKYPELKELEIKAFKGCLDKSMEEEVDFIIISGDLFHSNLPDMGIVKEVVGKLKEVNEIGIPVYISYGSHDFSPNETSIIDVITESGLLKKLFDAYIAEDETGKEYLKLNFTIDKNTNVKITGISGRKSGIEEEYYKILDRKNLENEDGFKIFVFHTSIKELIPDFLSKMDGINLSNFPKGFDYYAGGHIHKRIIATDFDGYGPIIYPGPPFAGYPRDMEMSAKGEKRGFYIVEFDEKIRDINFCELKLAEYQFFEYDSNNKTSNQLYDEIITEIENKGKIGKIYGKIVILKVKGELSGGKTSDINFQDVRKLIKEYGAIHVSINHHSLVSKDFSEIRVKGETTIEIEENILLENICNIDVGTIELKDSSGADLAVRLMKTIRQGPKHNEKKGDYNNRILNDSLRILELEGVLNDF
jgi:DNA repair protein SbcD/Mre11